MHKHPTGTVTFLFTDIEGSTKLAREFPQTWEAWRARHHQVLREVIESNNGFVFQIIGDAFCAAFYKAGDALRAAVKAQQDLQSENWGDCVIRVRMGIHTGEAEEQDSEYKGYLTLSFVQRLMSAGHGGQVLLSDAAQNSLHGGLPENTALQDLGKHYFKGFPDPLRVFQILAPGLPTSFPPLRALNIRPTNLPIQLTSFVGREKQLADVKRLLQDAHMLTLVGPGGTGKTRLAIQAGSELIEQYPDGVWLVELAPILDPVFVPRTTALTLGLRDEPQRPVIDMLCDYLRDKKILIILDNCEHLVDACARLADRVLHAAEDVRIFATSREALGIAGEVSYRVPSLELPDIAQLPPAESLGQYEAVKLFIDRATSAVPTFTVTNENAPALAQICHQLDGIPLAIELAAAKVRVLSLEQITKRLGDRLRLLTGGSRTVLERHQTLRAAIDWSYNLLPAAEQVLFRRLSVFVGGWTLEAAESVCADASVKSEDILNLLEHLINKSLVIMDEVQNETRYSILETLRQYANEKLVEAKESDALRDRHLEYFLNLAEAAEPCLIRPEQLEWLAKLDADYKNIRFALEWALGNETTETSLRLCAALGWFWWVRCYWQEGIGWLHSALNKPSQQSKRENVFRVKALYHDAALANELGDVEQMKRSAERSLSLAQNVLDKRDIAIARFYTGWALERLNNHHHALSLLEQSLKDFREIKDVYWESVAYRLLGYLRGIYGKINWDEQADYELSLARKAGERKNLADVLVNRAYQLFHLNRLEEAAHYAEEANMLSKQVGSGWNESRYFSAQISWLRGDYKAAREILMEIRERSNALGDRNGRSQTNVDLAILTLEEEDLCGARTYLEESLAIAREIGNKSSIAFRLAVLGNISYRETNMQEFKQSYRESFLLAQALGILAKRTILILMLYTIPSQKPQKAVRILGAINRSETESTRPVHPLWKRYCDRAEEYTRRILGHEEFEASFAEGQKLSMDEAIDLAQQTVEEM